MILYVWKAYWIYCHLQSYITYFLSYIHNSSRRRSLLYYIPCTTYRHLPQKEYIYKRYIYKIYEILYRRHTKRYMYSIYHLYTILLYIPHRYYFYIINTYHIIFMTRTRHYYYYKMMRAEQVEDKKIFCTCSKEQDVRHALTIRCARREKERGGASVSERARHEPCAEDKR